MTVTRVVALMVAALTASTTALEPAHFFLTETDHPDHALLLKQLDSLGIEPYKAPAGDSDLWAAVSKHHAKMDLVWSLDASPPYDKMRFAKTFRTKINHLPGAQRLTSSDLLWTHIRDKQRRLEKFNFNFVPSYLQLPRDNAKVTQLFADALKKVEFEMKRERDWHIYQRFLVREKPHTGNDAAVGPAVVVLSEKELQEKVKSEFAGKTVDVTQYIEPFLMDGHKFMAGFYVAVTSLDPLRVYTYSHPLIKIAKLPYPATLDGNSERATYNFNQYTAPWDFPELQKYYYEFPSTERPGTNSWNVVKRYLMLQGLDTARIQAEIDDAIVKTIVSNRAYFQEQIGKLQRFKSDNEANTPPSDLDQAFFETFRFDFELDDNGKAWLVKIQSNPSMAPEASAFGTDEAIKKNLLRDTLNLVGIHPQSKPSFDKYYRPKEGSTFCAEKCKDKSLVWNTACWACPGWFAPYVARRLFDSVHEYSRRGAYKLVYPALDEDYSKFIDNALSENDQAFDRYLKSLSASYAEHQRFDSTVVCVNRDHCSNHGDCINGKCFCDRGYEGSTCYVPNGKGGGDLAERDVDLDAHEKKDTWKDRVNSIWNRPAAQGARANDGVPRENLQDRGSDVAGGSTMFGLVFVAIFVGVAYRVFVTQGTGDTHKVN